MIAAIALLAVPLASAEDSTQDSGESCTGQQNGSGSTYTCLGAYSRNDPGNEYGCIGFYFRVGPTENCFGIQP